jgi:hypothetical protein
MEKNSFINLLIEANLFVVKEKILILIEKIKTSNINNDEIKDEIENIIKELEKTIKELENIIYILK